MWEFWKGFGGGGSNLTWKQSFFGEFKASMCQMGNMFWKMSNNILYFCLCLTLDMTIGAYGDKKYYCLSFLLSLHFSCGYCAWILVDLPHMSQDIEILFWILNIQLTICNKNPNSTLWNTLCSLKRRGYWQLSKQIKLYLIIYYNAF